MSLGYIAWAALNLPALLLFCYADRLGVWWAILLLAYMTGLNTVYVKIIRPRQLAKLRMDLGDELFFLTYPGEKKKLLRRKARERRRAERELRARQRRAERRGEIAY